ncbi:sn-glycerol-3-phosphate ABC transporter ATP-binding protein UgpC [bacterium]|nr:sn-glycerol-3-phosphate ABC transporter ATP-binding protein UgpC [bacterium]
MAEVRLSNVKKVYEGNVIAVHDFTLTVNDKEFVVLVGPSGCGKSTTLRMVAGLEEITEGEIQIGDRLVNNVPPKDRDIAMVFQNYALYPHMSVYKNMAFGLKLRGFPKKEIDERVREAAQILGLDDLLNRKPKQLSGGQRQRVAVGRAIVRKPKVFLFDEPLSNLDAKMRVQMRTEIAKLHTRLQATMLYVTHDQVEAMTMGDRIVVMKDGYIQQVADPITLYEHPENRFVAGFIGTPPMNFLQARIVAENGALWADGRSVRLRIPAARAAALGPYVGRDVTFGIRPEHIHDIATMPNAEPARIVKGLVDVIEPMGSETYLYLTADRHAFIAKITGHEHCDVGQTIPLVFDMDRAHFFDTETERVIR